MCVGCVWGVCVQNLFYIFSSDPRSTLPSCMVQPPHMPQPTLMVQHARLPRPTLMVQPAVARQ